MTTVRDALRLAVQRLTPVSGDAARLEARLLLQSVCGKTQVWLYQNPEARLSPTWLRSLNEAIEARQTGAPLAYLIGSREFYGRSFAVDHRVLIPRPETEDLIEAALRFARERADNDDRGLRIVDVGTGSGAIAVTLAAELPRAWVCAVDCSADALAVARQNAHFHRMDGRVSFLQSNLMSAIRGPVDLIVANLPYIPTGAISRLPIEVRREPRLALDGGPDGLDLYRHLFQQAQSTLHSSGVFLGEIAADQGLAMENLAHGFFPDRATRILPDLAGRDRLVAVGPRVPAVTATG